MQLTIKMWGLSIIALALIVIAIAYAVAPSAASPESLSEHIGYMLRVTARVGFGLLLLAYVARPFVQLNGWGRPLLIASLYRVGCGCQSHHSLWICFCLFDHVR